MNFLYILRHAKSSWAKPGLTDIDRPLNERGYRQSDRLQSWFSQCEAPPETALCSPAVRTRQTWDGIKDGLPGCHMKIQDDLYSGTLDQYLAAIWGHQGRNLLIIGHNPACDELVRHLTSPIGPAAERLMAHHFGTANLAVLRFEDPDWASVQRATGQLELFLKPKDLKSVGF